MPSLLQTLFSTVLEPPILEKMGDKELLFIKTAFNTTQIIDAYQNSYRYALLTMKIGLLAPEEVSTHEFVETFEQHYVHPFAKQSHLSKDDMHSFRSQTIESLKEFEEYTTDILPLKDITDDDFLALFTNPDPKNITDLLITQMQTVTTIDPILIDFLRYDGQLGDSVLFFFRSLIQQSDHFEHIHTTLQQEQLKQAHNRHNYVRRFKHRFHMRLEDIVDWHKNIVSIENPEWVHITAFMACQNLSSHIKGHDQLMPRHQQIIRQWAEQLKPHNIVASALYAIGEYTQSEVILQKILEKTQDSNEKALASYNLFHVILQRHDHASALKALQTAIAINPQRYALHDIKKYPLDTLLGAGSVGCVFLCHNNNALINAEWVIVKCLWETLLEDIPKNKDILDSGAIENRAFIVTKYISGAIDGEAWLEKNGPMTVKTALSVGLDIAYSLQGAHEEHLYHSNLKPANILFTQLDNAIYVKVIDFGFATQNPHNPYQSPEHTPSNIKSDLFAFAITLYRLITGKAAYPVLERYLPKVSELRELLADCMEANPNNRPDSAQYLINRLTHLLEGDQERIAVQEDKMECDKKAWEIACQENTVEAYQNYLNGETLKRYSGVAKTRRQKKESENQADERAWHIACEDDNLKSYQTYLNGNTVQKYAKAAQEILHPLKTKQDHAIWQEVIQQDTIQAYQHYLADPTLTQYRIKAKTRLHALSAEYRYIINGDGTVTDNKTGLIWLRDVSCLGKLTWTSAMEQVAALADGQYELTDHSKAGDWRLPAKNELKKLVDKRYDNPVISNATGTDKWTEGDAFKNVISSYVWTSTTNANHTSGAWYINLKYGYFNANVKTLKNCIWAVRD